MWGTGGGGVFEGENISSCYQSGIQGGGENTPVCWSFGPLYFLP